MMPDRVAAEHHARATRRRGIRRPVQSWTAQRGTPDIPEVVDVAAYLTDLRARMRKAVIDFVHAEASLARLRRYHREVWATDIEGAALAYDRDPEVEHLRSTRRNARERARTLALVILAEQGWP